MRVFSSELSSSSFCFPAKFGAPSTQPAEFRQKVSSSLIVWMGCLGQMGNYSLKLSRFIFLVCVRYEGSTWFYGFVGLGNVVRLFHYGRRVRATTNDMWTEHSQQQQRLPCSSGISQYQLLSVMVTDRKLSQREDGYLTPHFFVSLLLNCGPPFFFTSLLCT